MFRFGSNFKRLTIRQTGRFALIKANESHHKKGEKFDQHAVSEHHEQQKSRASSKYGFMPVPFPVSKDSFILFLPALWLKKTDHRTGRRGMNKSRKTVCRIRSSFFLLVLLALWLKKPTTEQEEQEEQE